MALHQGFPGIGSKSLVFTARRRVMELIRAAKPTPHEFKRLFTVRTRQRELIPPSQTNSPQGQEVVGRG